ncbi:MAG: rhodanese-like domain-containing protein, partial [Nitrospirales bacterium]
AGYAVWRLFKVTARLQQLRRDHYYTESRLKRIPEDIHEAIHPLRLHLAKIAQGGTVPLENILEGRLYQEVSAEDAQRALDQARPHSSNGVLVVDVRTPKEFAMRRVPGAKLVPFEELEARYQQDIPDAMEKIFVYCASGERSRFACDFLSRRGYTNLYHIRDGLRGWHGPTEGEGQVTFIQLQRRGGHTTMGEV